MDTVRVTFDLDLTLCRVSLNFCNMVTLWWVTNTVTHHLEVVNSPLSSCLPHKNGKNFSDRFSIILKVDFRSRAFFEFITVVSKDIPSEGKAKVLLFRRDFFAFWDCCIQYMD